MNSLHEESFAAYRQICRLRASQGGRIAYMLKQANVEADRYDADLWLFDTQGRETRLTFDGSVSSFWWQGEQLVFTRRAKGGDPAALPATQLWRMGTSGPGEAQPWHRLPGEVCDLLFLPKGRLLYTATWSAATDAALQKAGGDEAKADELLAQDASCEVFTEVPFWADGAGFTSGRRTRLYSYDNGEATPLTDTCTDIDTVHLSPCGGFLFYNGCRWQGLGSATLGLWKLELATGRSTFIGVEGESIHHAFTVMEDGSVAALVTPAATSGVNGDANFWQIFPTGGMRMLGSEAYSAFDTVASDLKPAADGQLTANGELIYWAGTVGHSSQLMCLNSRTGKAEPLTTRAGAVTAYCLAGGHLYYAAMRGQGGPELYTLEPNGDEVRLTTWNQGLAARFGYQKPRRLHFENSEGNTVEGWVLPPHGLDETESWPAVLMVHGGPKMVYGPAADHEMQLLASRGYAVLYCNPTGSDGKGDAFSDIRGRWGLIDFEDLMAFLDLCLSEYPWLDADRLAISGGSYGGFMVNWAIGHTGRFKAAISQRGIAHWASMALTSDIGHFFVQDETHADPWHDTSVLWEQSPLAYAPAVRTPTLFLHGEQDRRCPPSESVQMFSALRMHGVDARLVLFRGAGHGFARGGRPSQRIRRLREVLAWLDDKL